MEFDISSAAGSLAGFAVVGTIIGFIIRGWSSVKAFLSNMLNVVLVEVGLDDDATSQIVLAYIIKNYPRSKFCKKIFGGKYESLSDGKFGHIPFELMNSQSMTFWQGWLPFWFSIIPEKKDEKVISWGGYTPKPPVKSSIMYIRGTIDVEKIVREASKHRNDMDWSLTADKHKRFFIKRIPDPVNHEFSLKTGKNLAWYYEGVYRLLGYKPEDLGRVSLSANNNESAVKRLYFPKTVLKMIREVEMWRSRRQWYVDRGIPWKRGWLLYGVPGTGKSALARAIAEELDMPLFVYSLGRMLNEELEKCWIEMQANTPCIALFEDFDTVFDGRENIYGKPTVGDMLASKLATPGTNTNQTNNTTNNAALVTGKLSFDCLLNCIDGVEKTDGIFTIITTNHVEKLDSALGQPRKNADGSVEIISTRPGRIDKAIELGYMTVEDKLKLARRIFFDNNQGYQQVHTSIIKEPDRQETPAQFQERCAQLALEWLWAEENDNLTKEHDILTAPLLGDFETRI